MTMKLEKEVANLSLPQQNYVEAIAELVEAHGHAHPAKIAMRLNVKKPSVTEAIDRLVHMGIARRIEQKIHLTARGSRIAKKLAHRHDALHSFMVDVLEMKSVEADAVACRIEHVAEASLIERLLLLDDFFQQKGISHCRGKWREFLKKRTMSRK